MQSQSNCKITFDTQLKTALAICFNLVQVLFILDVPHSVTAFNSILRPVCMQTRPVILLSINHFSLQWKLSGILLLALG